MRFRLLVGVLAVAAVLSSLWSGRWVALVLWIAFGGAAQVALRYPLVRLLRRLPVPGSAQFLIGVAAATGVWSLVLLVSRPVHDVLFNAVVVTSCAAVSVFLLPRTSPAAVALMAGVAVATVHLAVSETAMPIAENVLAAALVVWVPARSQRHRWTS